MRPTVALAALLLAGAGFQALPDLSLSQAAPSAATAQALPDLSLSRAAPSAAAAGAPAPAPPEPPDIPLDRVGWIAGAALLINRLIQLLKQMQGVFPAQWKPYLPLVAAGLGLAAGVLDHIVAGSPWYVALITGVVGAAGAVFVREAGRAVTHARSRPPKAGGDMDDGELADAVSGG